MVGIGGSWRAQQTIRLSNETDLEQFAEELKRTLGSMPDLIFRSAGSSLIVYMAGLADQQRIEREIVDPLTDNKHTGPSVITTPSVQLTDSYQQTVQSILSGMAAVAMRGQDQVLLANVAAYPDRGVPEPHVETSILGPQEAFSENLDTNVALIRRITKSEKLRMKVWHYGSVAHTEVRLLYFDQVAQDELVQEMSQRLDRVHLEDAFGSNYIAESIKDRPLSLFPTVQKTERPDVVANALMKGKVAVAVNNTPIVLLFPFTFWNAFETVEDIHLSYSSATFLRWIRSVFILSALLLPSLYVAITTFHNEMLPTNLLLSIAASREASPFPAFVEAFIMESIFEAMREAIVRMPRVLVQAVSVVGALVIGQAIVQAGIVSIPMIIVVSITGIASLMIPHYETTFAIRILRILLLLMAGGFGFFGIALGLFFTQVYLTGLRSAGMPYLAPVAPMLWKMLKKLIIRQPFERS